jgi:serine/threonine protein kinase
MRGGELERLVVNTASALAAIHGAGIVHRDLKPANVLLGPDGPRVVDFGIARAIDAETHTQMVGTPAYFAPEWLRGEQPTPASDVFAWAGTMVFAATGRPPFGPSGNLAAMMHRIASAEPDLTGVPSPLRDLLVECLDKDPARRPAARDLLVRLVDPTAATRPTPQQARPAPYAPPQPPAAVRQPPPYPGPPVAAQPTQPAGWQPSRQGGRWPLLALGAAVLVAAAVAVTFLLTRHSGSQAERQTNTPSASAKTSTSETATTPSTGASANAIPAPFGGTWTGTLKQEALLGDAPTTSVSIKLTAGGTSGTANYKEWNCTSTLTVTSASATSVQFDEATSGNPACQGGSLTLTRAGDTLKYVSDGITGTTSGSLRKAA